ncbi:transposase [Syntrophomonas erecta]
METVKKVSLESGVSILGYCLMTNHVHLLLREDDSDISVFMKRLGVSYAYWYNCRYERTGHVFQDRFKSECFEDDAYLLAVIGYIHQNSIKTSITSILANQKSMNGAVVLIIVKRIETLPHFLIPV